ncbi:long-chain-fatty-acid--CoA ligase 1-like [Diadema antillarum]|uniref:long-chain-fatty-acid--CoA ligase 1-like n=1 Tax=Diadema antillarum TaxID=105358 RepID=UPI003A8B170C
MRAQQFGSALIEKGFTPSSDSKIGIFSDNRPEWVITDLGCVTFSMVTVPLYSNLRREEWQYIINQTDMELVVVDTLLKVKELLEFCQYLMTLKYIVVMETAGSEELRDRARDSGITLLGFDELLAIGLANSREPTTIYAFPSGCVSISFLPLAQRYEHTVQTLVMTRGGSVGFSRGNTPDLLADMQELKPDFIPCDHSTVIRLYDEIIGTMRASSYFQRAMINWAFDNKKTDAKNDVLRRDTWSDTLVFNKFQDLVGGKLKWILSGGGPIPPEISLFLRVVCGCPVSEVYEMTEVGGVISGTVAGETESGHVGSVMPCCVVKLIDVPEMGYWTEEDQGEICVKGPAVSSGYFKETRWTAASWDSDGWLHTGDIGEWLLNGALRIVGRQEHMYRTSEGHCITPERLEGIMTKSRFVSQAFVYGNDQKKETIAVLVADEDELETFAKNNDLTGTPVELCKDKILLNEVKADLNQIYERLELCDFEKVNEFIFQPHPFSVEDGLLTPTGKNRRDAIMEHFQADIDGVYALLE